MKKFLPAVAVAVALIVPSTASAANVYTINFSTNPTNSGTTKKPTPVGGKFGFSVTDTENKRPFALDAFRATFGGIRMNTRFFPTCSAAEMEQRQTNSFCPAGSRVATGFANNIAGDRSTRDDTSQRCYLTLTMHNSGANKATLFVQGSSTAAKPCPIEVATAIPMSVVRTTTGDRLSFVIPENLKFPLGTFRNSLVETSLTLLKKTVRRSGRTRGFFETVGQCSSSGRRQVKVTFDNEGNNDTTQSGQARCSK